MGNELAQQIEQMLGPLVGTVLASVTVDLESKRVGKCRDTITREDVSAIADNLTSQLRLLVGQDIAEAAARQVRALQ